MKIQRRTLFPSGQPKRAKEYVALLERSGDESISALFKRVTIKPSYHSMIREPLRIWIPPAIPTMDEDLADLETLHAATETARPRD